MFTAFNFSEGHYAIMESVLLNGLKDGSREFLFFITGSFGTELAGPLHKRLPTRI